MSHVERQANPQSPRMGGSRCRYFFRTSNGQTADPNGGFYRLTKRGDRPHDAPSKTGPLRPDASEVDPAYLPLLTWFDRYYYESGEKGQA